MTPFSVVGELTADGRSIVLMATGAEHEIIQAAKLLELLTPLIKKSDPPGALVLPLTWAATVQLAYTFGPAWRPGPRLLTWLTAEVVRRTATDVALNYRVPEGLTPRPYQVQGAQMIAATGRALLFDEAGTGKTITTILGLVERHTQYSRSWPGLGAPDSATDPVPASVHNGTTVSSVFPVIVICPASVVDPWVQAWQTWAPSWRVTAWRGSPAHRRRLADRPPATAAHVVVTSYDTARMDAAKGGPLDRVGARSVVVDECFPAGTQVATPTGPRPIESLHVGDEVIGVDHVTGKPVVTTVRHTFTRTADESLTEVNGVSMTPNHPVWTTRGYVPAIHVRRTDKVCFTLINWRDGDLHAELRVVRADVHQVRLAHRTAAVLQPELLGTVAHVEPGVRRVARYPEAAGSGGREHPPLAGVTRGTGDAEGAPGRREQPDQGPSRTGQGSDHAARAWIPDTQRRERSTNRATEAVGRALGLGHRGLRWLTAALLDRRGECGADDRGRVRRREPQEPENTGARRPEGRVPTGSGLDGAPVRQPAGPDRDGRRGAGDHGSRRVFNIETGTGNYVAGGLLVHNCHMVKSSHSARSMAARRLARRAAHFVALSGTPITHHPGDLWPTLEALAHDAWPAGERWKARYCVTVPGDYSARVLGLHAATEPEFRATLLGQHRRVAKADVLDQLPPKVYSVRTVELSAAYRTAYNQMETDMIAQLPDGGELSVMSVLAQLTRLSQLASAAADVEVTSEPDAEGELREHVTVRLKAPSWKVDALLEVLAERPGEPVVCFAPSRQLMTLAGAQAAAAGLQVGYVVGGQSMRERTETVEAFQRGKLDLLCATTGAGGVGLTLTAARTVVFLQRPWSLVEASQAEDRCHRIGSEVHDCIEIIDIVAADTVDARVRSVLLEKAGQLADLLQDRRIVTQLLGGLSARRTA